LSVWVWEGQLRLAPEEVAVVVLLVVQVLASM